MENQVRPDSTFVSKAPGRSPVATAQPSGPLAASQQAVPTTLVIRMAAVVGTLADHSRWAGRTMCHPSPLRSMVARSGVQRFFPGTQAVFRKTISEETNDMLEVTSGPPEKSQLSRS